MRRKCCWCERELGEKVPLEVEDVTGGACELCTNTLLESIRQESGWTYTVVLSRECSHLFSDVNTVLQVWPHVKVLVDRRVPVRRLPRTAPRPLVGQPREAFTVPPRIYHLVIRKDCAHLYEDLAPLFTGRSDIRVIVDRRSRPRSPALGPSSAYPRKRQGDPPAWLV